MDRRRASVGRRASGMQVALLDAVRRGRFRQAQLLVEAGADVDAVDHTGETALLACVTRLPEQQQQPGGTRAKLLRLLLDAGSDPNAVDRQGRCALMHAAIAGQTDTVLTLLDHPGIDLELQDLSGNTTLMHAARHGYPDVVAALLRQMGRLRQILHLSQRNHAGRTAVQLAQRHGHARVAAALGCCVGPTNPSGNPTNIRPTFPRPPGHHHDDQDDDDDHDNNFPNPRMLERGPTPGSPLLSFPARWQQRKLLDERKRESGDGSDPDDDDFRVVSPVPERTAGRLPDKAVRVLDHAGRVLDKVGSLPRLRHHQEADTFLIDLNSSYGSCRSDDSSGYDSVCRTGCWTVPDDCSGTAPAGPDRFRRVLNLLDAAIQEDDVDLPDTDAGPVRWTAGTVPAVVGTEVGRNRAVPRSVRRSSNYFPPVRPVRAAGLGLLLPVQDRANRTIPPIPRAAANLSNSSTADSSKL